MSAKRRWRFTVECVDMFSRTEMFANYFCGTDEEAQAELRERIARTWSPFVVHSYKPADQEAMQP